MTKLRWLASHEPDAIARTASVCLPHDYLTWRLTGEFATDRGDASGTGYWSPAEGRWRADLLRLVSPDRDWSDALQTNELKEGKPKMAVVGDAKIFLLKRGGGVLAIGAVCSHAGGPLEQGALDDGCITCPWHGSKFRVDDGSVVRGPAATSQPAYDVRIEADGMVRVRSR